MIRIYFDWNIISNLKTQEYKNILDFISSHKNIILAPYSQAHFTDLMKSYHPKNKYFEQDLEMLDLICDKYLLSRGKDGVEPSFALPSEYFETQRGKPNPLDLVDIDKIFGLDDEDLFRETESNSPITDLKNILDSLPSGIEITDENKETLKNIFPNLTPEASVLDLIRDLGPFMQKVMTDKSFIKELRQVTADQGYTVKHEYGNWASDAVMKNMDTFLKKKNPDLGLTFDKFVEMSYTKQNNSYDFHDHYISEYLLLDMLGYCSDKLKKQSNNFQNIIADAMHSFYASHCDYLVTIDKNLIEKSRVLYSKYNVGTNIISPEDLIGEISKKIEKQNRSKSFLSNVFSYCKDEYCVAEGEKDEEDKIETLVFKLPIYHFNYYNYLIQTYYPKQNIVLFTFKQDIQGFTNFHYFIEIESVFDSVSEFFGYDDFSEIKSTRKDYIYSDKNVSLDWTFEGGKIRLGKDEDTKRSVLTYLLEVDKFEMEN